MLSLWLIPDEQTNEKLTQLISQLSDYYQTPKFEPHVTLLSGMTESKSSVADKTRILASKTTALDLKLSSFGYLDMYYKCLFFNTSESQTLLNLREKALNVFETENKEPFIPHISFLYGDVPKFTKLEIINSLKENFFMPVRLTAIRLVSTPQFPDSWQTLEEWGFEM